MLATQHPLTSSASHTTGYPSYSQSEEQSLVRRTWNWANDFFSNIMKNNIVADVKEKLGWDTRSLGEKIAIATLLPLAVIAKAVFVLISAVIIATILLTLFALDLATIFICNN